MDLLQWAEREVDLAYKREAPDRKEGEWDYSCACYESAMKAFKSLMEDGHSGYSIGMTKHILMRLIDGKPLTPIEGKDDEWTYSFHSGKNEDIAVYQNKRMSSLFKNVHPDGTVTYDDNDRYYCEDVNDPYHCWHSGFVRGIIDEMFPITMPYMPTTRPMRVVCEEFLTDRKNGDFDTLGVLYAIKPDGERIDILRYFDGDGPGWREIDLVEYSDRKIRSIERC